MSLYASQIGSTKIKTDTTSLPFWGGLLITKIHVWYECVHFLN